ncbi:putative glycoside hydrolase [Clostridium facile]|uniref:DUF4015 domain-containing protein n=1 Tax=Clostridium facile TaxID=2763035 RepID=A0ABR7INK5_9CLOT|nr:putative glycoside hydrolase [Clostridium facile]MBC5786718.1 hypothetical protein [Clostridium facile]
MSKPVKVKRYDKIYRGKGPSGGGFWKIFRWIIAFLLIVAIAFFIFSQFLGNQKNSTQTNSSSMDISSVDASSEISSEETSSSEPESESQATTRVSVELPENLLRDSAGLQSFLTQSKTQGYDSVIIPFKTEKGQVLYQTQVVAATQWGAVTQNPVNAQEIYTTVKNAGLTPIAQLSAFQDSTAANGSRDNAITYQGQPKTTWLQGNEKIRWLNPYKDSARAYIKDLAAELHTMGYEYVMLTNVQFPTAKDTRYDLFDNGVSKQDILKQFIREVNATGVKVILSYSWDAATGAGEMAYGGDPSTYGAAINAPVIDLSAYPSGLEQNGSVITDQTQIVQTVVTTIQANSGNSEVLPVLQADQNRDQLLSALSSINVKSHLDLQP